MKVKIVDVAKEANVSVATVSRVVNNIPLVNEETKKRVLKAIKKTGYKPNAIARSLKIQKTNTLGIMIPDITSPFYTEIVRGAEDVSGIYNYNIILINTDMEPAKEKDSLGVLLEKQCDGVMFVGKNLSEELREELIKAPCQVVLGCVPDSGKDISSVLIDNEQASYELAKKCIEKGHREFALFYDEMVEGYVNQERISGVKRAFKEHDIHLDESLLFYGRETVLGGYKSMEKALMMDKPFTAALCYNDQMALGAIRAAQQKGIAVPEDISVCGFNDLWISQWVQPEITTIGHPMYDIGAIATRMLIKLCEKEETEIKSIRIPFELIERNSLIEKNN
ncbi:MAG: LacI family transcriptional regulator [Eubacteriaceae bacterium]|jgi:LacI family transcriptional regulator|nr:LacI family transcriptional regulator [Eubacteriaceae bacterium]